MVLRDTIGHVLDYSLRRFNGVCQPKEAEAIGMRQAVIWIREKQVSNVTGN